MIVCGNCSYENEDGDQFCGSCGSPLAWTGQKVESAAPPPEPEVEDEAVAPEDRRIVEKVKDVLTGREAEVQAEAQARAAEAEARVEAEAAAARDAADAETARAQEAEAYAGVQEGLAQKAQAEAEAAERARVEAEAKAEVEAAAATAARLKADELELARAEAMERAEKDAAEAASLKRKLEEADKARIQMEERLAAEAEAATRAKAEAEAAALKAAEDAKAEAQAEGRAAAEAEAARLREQAEAAEKARQEAESRLALERQAIVEAKAAAEKAEADRKAAEEKAKKDAEEADAARRAAEEAEQARREAEEKAKKEAEEAARARRAAAMVAKSAAKPVEAPKPTAQAPAVAAAGTAAATPQKPQAVAQKPQKVAAAKKPPPPKKPKEAERKYNPGDLICGDCGEGNSAERKFCKKCGNSLATAEVAATPWWKRIFRRKPKTFAAGERKKGATSTGAAGALKKGKRAWYTLHWLRGRVFRTIMMVGFAAGMVGISVSPLRQDVTNWFGDRADSVKCFVKQPEAQQVATATASSENPEHVAIDGADLNIATYWQTETPTATFTVEFFTPLDITHIQFLPGTAGGAVDLARPEEVHVTFTNRDGQRVGPIIMDGLQPVPDNDNKPERRAVSGAEQATGATLEIVSTHPGQEGAQQVALREIEFLAKNC